MQKSTCIIFCFSLILAASTPASLKSQEAEVKRSKTTQTYEGKKYYIHTVEKGQTIYGIAKAYSLEVNDIIIENPEAIDGIKSGQTLKIPAKKPATKWLIPKPASQDSGDFMLHKAEQGQTLYSISKKYQCGIDELIKLNPALKDGLKTGQLIKIPRRPGKSTGTLPLADAGDSLLLTDPGVKKDRYNIALFLPFDLRQATELNTDEVSRFPIKSQIAVEFYQGALMAIDSLKKTGLSCRLFVYDAEESDSVLNSLLKKPEMKEIDLIIGPLSRSNFSHVARFAKENKIPAVAPYLQQNKILFENPWVSKVIPSLTSQHQQLSLFIADSFRTANIILAASANARDAAMAKSIKQDINSRRAQYASPDSVRQAGSFSQTEQMLKEGVENVVVLVSNNQAQVTDFITKLYQIRDQYKITLVGLQSWMEYDNLDIEQLNALQLHLPSSSFIDYESPSMRNLIKKYRQQYRADPGEYFFHGYDVGFYYLKMLLENGTGFYQRLPALPYQGLQTSYNMYRPLKDSGFENKSVFVLKYKDYRLIKVN